MEVILLEKVANLGSLGDKVKVKAGYGRNFLLPYGNSSMRSACNSRTSIKTIPRRVKYAV